MMKKYNKKTVLGVILGAAALLLSACRLLPEETVPPAATQATAGAATVDTVEIPTEPAATEAPTPPIATTRRALFPSVR